MRTLYIDRDPSTFCDISLHLQGYHIEPRDGAHFVKLFADAQFFSRKCRTPALNQLPGFLKKHWLTACIASSSSHLSTLLISNLHYNRLRALPDSTGPLLQLPGQRTELLHPRLPDLLHDAFRRIPWVIATKSAAAAFTLTSKRGKPGCRSIRRSITDAQRI